MNDTQNQTASDSVGAFAAEINAVLLKGARSPEENKRCRAEIHAAATKNRIIAAERRLERLKKRAKRALQGEFDYE